MLIIRPSGEDEGFKGGKDNFLRPEMQKLPPSRILHPIRKVNICTKSLEGYEKIWEDEESPFHYGKQESDLWEEKLMVNEDKEILKSKKNIRNTKESSLG